MAARKIQQKNNIRLIAGYWRGRKIPFIDAEGLRPTPDRVRETLFNWLQSVLPAAVCVDCFAGSGALGFEAASRGAKKVILLETNPAVIKQLEKNKQLLNAEVVEIISTTARDYLQQLKPQADIFFLDPPFASYLMQEALGIIINNNLLKKDGLVYLEYPGKEAPLLPEMYTWYRQRQAGDVGYGLVRRAE